MKRYVMIKTKWIYCTVLLILCCVAFSSCAKKEHHRVYRVGILSGLNNFAAIGDAFKQKMTSMGYVEGKDIVYDFQKTNFEMDKEKQILKKFVADKVDLIFGFNTEVALEAKAATQGTDIPVIFAMGIIEGSNLINSVQAPGGNITGVRYPGVDFALKRFEILREMLPEARRIWIPYQKDYPAAAYELQALRPVAASSGVTLIEFPADNLTHLQTELENRSKSGDIGFDAVLYIPESLSTTKAAFEIIAGFTRERKIPVGGTTILSGDYGTLFSVSISSSNVGELAAYLADKVIKGVKAGTIPVISPEPYLIINYKVAKELGLTVPDGLLHRANEIIR